MSPGQICTFLEDFRLLHANSISEMPSSIKTREDSSNQNETVKGQKKTKANG